MNNEAMVLRPSDVTDDMREEVKCFAKEKFGVVREPEFVRFDSYS